MWWQNRTTSSAHIIPAASHPGFGSVPWSYWQLWSCASAVVPVSTDPTVRPTVNPAVTFKKCDTAGSDRVWIDISRDPAVNPRANDLGINWVDLITISVSPYTTLLGPFAFVVICAIPFVMLAIRQQSSLIPAICGCLIGTFILAFIPPEYHLVALAFIALIVQGPIWFVYAVGIISFVANRSTTYFD